MADAKKPPPRDSSRTLVIVAVAVLIVVAIAGIVLAGRKAPEVPDDAPLAASAASGSTSQAVASPTDGLPKEVTFAPASDKLPAGINEGLARFAEAARGNAASSIRVSARFATNKESDRELAKARTGAIRHSLESNGVNGGKVQVELIEMAESALPADAVNRVDLSLR